MGVDTRLTGSDGKDKTSDEQHDNRVGKCCHYRLVAEQRAYGVGVAHEYESTVTREYKQ